MDTVDEINRIKDPMLRADSAGTMQAVVGLWQIFTRSGSLPANKADETFAGVVKPFADVRSDRTLFDAGRDGVKLLLANTGPDSKTPPQERIIDLLAGAANPSDVESHTQVVEEMVRIMEAQRIISLNDLFAMGDQLDRLARGEKPDTALINRLSGRISEIQLPRASLSAVEKNSLSFGFWTEKHVDAERKLKICTPW